MSELASGVEMEGSGVWLDGIALGFPTVEAALRNLIRENSRASALCRMARLVLSLGQVQSTIVSFSFGISEGFAWMSFGGKPSSARNDVGIG